MSSNQTSTQVVLSQANFSEGTYRIKTPGNYILKEDIIFNPPNSGVNLPQSGFFFSALTVETAGVTFNLNGYTVSPDPSYVQNNLGGNFSVVLLGNSVDPLDPAGKGLGSPYGAKFFSFPGDTAYFGASNVTIKNGSILGNGASWGIKGSNNSMVTLEDLIVKDCLFDGINLQHVTKLNEKRVVVTGLTTPVLNNATKVQINLLKVAIPLIPSTVWDVQIPTTQADVLANLDQWVLDNQADYNQVYTQAPTTHTGEWITSGSQLGTIWSNDPFPITPEECSQKAAASNGGQSSSVSLDKIKVENMSISTVEVPTYSAPLTWTGPNGVSIPPYFLGVFGTARVRDLYSPDGTFAPNALAYAIASLEYVVFVTNPTIAAMYPTTPGSTVATILSQIINPTAFVGVEESGRGPYYYANEGLHGVRVECSTCVFEKNICVRNLTSNGAPGIGSNSSNRVNGLTFSTVSNLKGGKDVVANLNATNGTVTAYWLDPSVFDSNLQDLSAANLYTSNIKESVVGVQVKDTEGLNLIDGVELVNLTGSNVFPVLKENAPYTTVSGVTIN